MEAQSEQLSPFTQTATSISREPVRLSEEIPIVANKGNCMELVKPTPISTLVIIDQGISRKMDPLTHVCSAKHSTGGSCSSKLSQSSQLEILLIGILSISPNHKNENVNLCFGFTFFDFSSLSECEPKQFEF